MLGVQQLNNDARKQDDARGLRHLKKSRLRRGVYTQSYAHSGRL